MAVKTADGDTSGDKDDPADASGREWSASPTAEALGLRALIAIKQIKHDFALSDFPNNLVLLGRILVNV